MAGGTVFVRGLVDAEAAAAEAERMYGAVPLSGAVELLGEVQAARAVQAATRAGAMRPRPPRKVRFI